jgi:predicted nucleotidyltransferase
MEVRSIESVIRALNDAGVRYLIAGGVAVVAHGYVRYTADLDLILELSETNLRPALAALTGLGYRPTAPVPLEAFADGSTRAEWIQSKGLTVLSLFSPQHQRTVIDLFVEEPLDFAKAFASALRLEVAAGVPATFVNLDDLLELKRRAARPKDQIDIEHLEKIREGRANGGNR